VAVSLKGTLPGVKAGRVARRAVEETAELLRSLGHEVGERDPKYGQLTPAIMPRYLAGVADDAAKLDHPERLEARSRRMAWWGRRLHGRALRRAVRRRANGASGAGITTVPAPDTVDDAILRAARAIDGLLARDGSAVPFYVFGHTHRAAQLPLREGERPAWYFNTGAWASGVEPPPFLPYLHIERNGGPTARLLAWNDAERAPAPLARWVRAGAAPPRPPVEDPSETALAPR
jgi:hypothetical protein